MCRMRILTPVELKEQRLRVSTREHERIMDMLLENEAAIEKVTIPPLFQTKTLARRIDEMTTLSSQRKHPRLEHR